MSKWIYGLVDGRTVMRLLVLLHYHKVSSTKALHQ